MRAELRARVAGVRVELGVGPGPGELARSRSGPQARICTEHDAAVDTDNAELRIGRVGTAALRIRDVVTDRGRSRLGSRVIAVRALDVCRDSTGERPEQRDGQHWGDEQARTDGQLGWGHVDHGEAERVAIQRWLRNRSEVLGASHCVAALGYICRGGSTSFDR